MAMYTSGELEELKTCPYNVSHRITAKRFLYHLVRCRKANPHVKLVTCPLFAEHKVPEPELEYHIQTCEQRKQLEQELYRDEPIEERWKIDRNVPIEYDDTWETTDAPSYNPQLYCEQNRVIRTIQVEPPSVRKQFRQAERERHQMLDRLEREKNEASLKAKKYEESDLSERESTSEASGFSVYGSSDIEESRKKLIKILMGRGKPGENCKKNQQPPVGIVPPKLLSETSNRESATTSDGSTLVDSLSDLNIDDTKTSREEEWVKVSHGYGRGRGRKIRK
nr:gametocyte-specific factor 1 homolog [Onthophagus taurus]